ncbi:MAG: family peptidase [Naasia sp.]|nr:family peptidase [Naasia sp.]
MTRRSLRHGEQAARASLRRGGVRRSTHQPTSGRTAPAPRPGRFARLARPLFTATTMLAVAAMALVTSVPANALLTDEDIVTARLANFASAGEEQELGTIAGGEAVVTRDGYSVRTAAENALADRFGGVDSFVNNRQSAIQWPFAVAVPVSDGFGYRNSPCSGCSSQHQGTDFVPGSGAPIQAIADGVVRTVVQSDSGLGVYAVIEHLVDGDLVTSTYAHMQFGSVPLREGQAVAVGDLVGLVGNTGASTGPHLHFELRLGGTKAVDAYAWLQAHAG